MLLGFMGAGKTTLGKIIARNTGMRFYDLDWYIEYRFRKSIPQIFAERGEEGFRQLEREMLHEVGEFEDVIISCGGGTPCFFDNMDYMNAQGDTLYLNASPDVLYSHLMLSKGNRPLLEGKSEDELKSYIKSTLEAREPFYTKARHIYDMEVLDTRDKAYDSAKAIQEILGLEDKQESV